ncbi:MAG: GGDEF and EAL domain-containing protein [Thermoanaerobaculaceae bacterium]|nr:GGDEF and EAL domain-containing protein [Thermoanaerobaculaceae bacterium]MDI9623063.1 GGDEF and EAL domain-containing protein [Acidobacteriota bacterium]NLH10556.1 EAL domain-containing protein [Holophagae bacterium]
MPPLTSRALLVADPGPLARELEAALGGGGWGVDWCSRADEAVSLSEPAAHTLAMVVIDDSPRARGELVRALREMPGGESLLILGVGRAFPSNSVGTLVDDWVILPLRRGELNLRLRLAAGQIIQRQVAPFRPSPPADSEPAPQSEALATEPEEAPSARPLPSVRSLGQTLRTLLRGWIGAIERAAAPPASPSPAAVATPSAAEPSAAEPAAATAGASPVHELTISSGDFRAIDPSVSGAPDGLWDWDLVTHTVTLSPELQALRGFTAEEVVTTEEDFFALVHPHDRDGLKDAVAAHLEHRSPHFESEHRIQLADGGFGWMLSRGIAFRDAFGQAVRMVGSQSGLNRRTGIDPITGMLNRAYFLVRLARAMEASHVPGNPQFAVLFFNLDRFKNVNYTLGHRVGDQLLAAVAGRLRDCLRGLGEPLAPWALGAHLSADEFAILLERIVSPSDAITVAKAVQECLRAPFAIEGQELFVTTCIGIATSERPYARPEDLVRDADAAAHQARSQGRSTHAVFQESMHDDAERLLRLETDLRRGVQRNEFRVYYQPIVLLSQGTVAGFEALVRWQHPSGRLIMPADFIPLAEEIGLITDIDRWVLNEVCRQLRVWETQFRRRPPLTVAVNFSGIEFQKPEITMEIDRALRAHGVWGRNLKIEITESVIMEHARYAADILAHLRALDIRLSIDDFGTGYSSLSYLRRFEIDLLKIDKSFVGRMDTDQDSEEIVRTIVTLAKNLGKEVVAEGVERRRQLDQLKALGCRFGQGYLFSRPVEPRAATALLADEASGNRLFRA